LQDIDFSNVVTSNSVLLISRFLLPHHDVDIQFTVTLCELATKEINMNNKRSDIQFIIGNLTNVHCAT